MEEEVCDELIRLLRVQRHDFINHLQVIHAMLEMGKNEQAMRYIKELAENKSLITEALMLHKPKENCQLKQVHES